MKRLLIAVAIAALAIPVTFAQMPKGQGKGHAQHATSGKAVRKTITVQSLPQATQQAITNAVGSGKITHLTSVTTDGVVTYQATVQTGNKRSTMNFDASGNHL